MLGFDGFSLPVEIRALAREFDIGGVILFARNVESPEQVAELGFEAARLVPDLPLWVGVDQEGGRVARLKHGFTRWPPAAALGRHGDAGLADRFARALARELRAVGITMDFAPVLDVLTNRANPVIGDRALAGEAGTVARLGTAIIHGLQDEGVAGCGKHFPGHGDTAVDSHHDLPVVEHGADRLRGVEFVPFRAAVQAGVAAMMTAHVLVPAIDGQDPASMSRAVVTGLLRDELGFDGLVFTDDLSMRACADRYTPATAAVAAIAAGGDVALLCEPNPGQQAAALEALVHALEGGTLTSAAVDLAIARQRRAKDRFLLHGRLPGRPGGAMRTVLGCDAHQAIADEMTSA